MEVQIAVSKINKYADSDSGDTVEVIERPNGGLSVVIADGQTSGRGAKWISTLAVRKVITLLYEGVRDGAAARAASDDLYMEHKGEISATLNIISADLQTNTLVITRNNPAPVLLVRDEVITPLGEESQPIGLEHDTRPSITELPLEVGIIAIVYTDGLIRAGSRQGAMMDISTDLQAILEEADPDSQNIADCLLDHAMRLDQGRPSDDISVVVLRVIGRSGDAVRRMTVCLPLV